MTLFLPHECELSLLEVFLTSEWEAVFKFVSHVTVLRKME